MAIRTMMMMTTISMSQRNLDELRQTTVSRMIKMQQDQIRMIQSGYGEEVEPGGRKTLAEATCHETQEVTRPLGPSRFRKRREKQKETRKGLLWGCL